MTMTLSFLFSSGSRLAAKASLDDGTAFSTSQFRRSAVAVHAACNGIAEEHGMFISVCDW